MGNRFAAWALNIALLVAGVVALASAVMSYRHVLRYQQPSQTSLDMVENDIQKLDEALALRDAGSPEMAPFPPAHMVQDFGGLNSPAILESLRKDGWGGRVEVRQSLPGRVAYDFWNLNPAQCLSLVEQFTRSSQLIGRLAVLAAFGNNANNMRGMYGAIFNFPTPQEKISSLCRHGAMRLEVHVIVSPVGVGPQQEDFFSEE